MELTQEMGGEGCKAAVSSRESAKSETPAKPCEPKRPSTIVLFVFDTTRVFNKYIDITIS